VIVQQGGHRGLLLPDLEGVDDAKTQLRIAAEKGGIDLRQPHELFTFTVRRYH
jgi:AMMECR1 domain-containing protein